MNIQHDTRQVEVLRPRESEPEREVGWRPGGTGIAPPAPDFHFFSQNTTRQGVDCRACWLRVVVETRHHDEVLCAAECPGRPPTPRGRLC